MLAIVLAVLPAALGCGPSEEDVQRRFNDHVSGANACTAASECAPASAGCPLGCQVAVRTERVADVEAKARQLIKEYERGGRRCDYECRVTRGIACLSSRCAILYEPLPDAGGGD
jgi:hypothetical protein